MKIILLHRWLNRNKYDIIEIDHINGIIMIKLGIAIMHSEEAYKRIIQRDIDELPREADYTKKNS
jgi:hypothetical protein